MSIGSYFLARVARLPPRISGIRRVNHRVVMPDGVGLQTRHYAPRISGRHPTILLRLPYGLNGFSTVAEVYAERGFNVVLQACRGTGKSGGEFDPLVNERGDGLATLAWIAEQPWYDGRLGLSGQSYLGYAQWAISDAMPKVSAMATKITSAEFKSVVFPSGAFHLGLWLGWLQTVEGLRKNGLATSRRMFSGDIDRRTAIASMTLPLVEADIAAVGYKVPFWRKWFAEALDNPDFWTAIDHTGLLGPNTPPNSFMSGWYDFMLDQLLRDYATLVAFGHHPHLTIGPWTHVHPDLQMGSIGETLTWMRAHLLGDRSGLREKPVRIHISGTNTWHEFDAFPPRPPRLDTWNLQSGFALSQDASGAGDADRYQYDPADPTPNIGGAIFAFVGAGPLDNTPRETRADVLSYTSAPLEKPVTIIGKVQILLHAKARVPHADFFLRLCDVSPDGISTNICDGLVRATPETPVDADGTWTLRFAMHATAHCFLAGHRLRLQVSSGAHPRYARNLGTDEPIGTATSLVANDIEVLHDPERPSWIVLPAYELA